MQSLACERLHESIRSLALAKTLFEVARLFGSLLLLSPSKSASYSFPIQFAIHNSPLATLPSPLIGSFSLPARRSRTRAAPCAELAACRHPRTPTPQRRRSGHRVAALRHRAFDARYESARHRTPL